MKNYILLIIILFAFNNCAVVNDSINVIDCDKLGENEVKICDQIWMTRNLDVDHYRNGDSIRYCETQAEWQDAAAKKEGACCYYNDDPTIDTLYGKLYNWYAVNDTRGLAPKGWHIPSGKEFDTLVSCLGFHAGGKVKESGYDHWEFPNYDATNESGFSALPGGISYIDGTFEYLKTNGYYWASNEGSPTVAWAWGLSYVHASLYGIYDVNKGSGISVRCVQDK